MPISKAEQVAEAAARAEAGVSPGETVDAVSTIDDNGPGEGDAPAPQRTEPAPAEQPRPAPRIGSKSDDIRSQIVARFRTDRTTEAADNTDQISDFARDGTPPEFQNPLPPEPIEAEPIEAEPVAAAPRTYKVKVHGKEMELTEAELVAKAQIALASDNLLDEGKRRLTEIDQILEQTRNKVARGDQSGGVNQPAAKRPGVNQPGEQPLAQTAELDPDAADGAVNQDPIDKLIETIQFGVPAEAAQLLRKTIGEVSGRQVTEELQRQRLRDESVRSNKVLQDFTAKHADLANDPLSNAAIERRIYDLQIEDMNALGIDPNQIPTPDGRVTPAVIAQAHLWYRSQGYNVRKPDVMLETATADFLAWKGVATQKPVAADPAKPAAPRVAVSVDRTERRAAIPQQPTRTAAVIPVDQRAAPQRDRSSVVADIVAQRNRPRGKAGMG
jgi:hypothetical protein